MARSPKWAALRKRFVKKHPLCAGCGRKDRLNVHHIIPIHERIDLELEWNNLLTLCEWPTWNCHLRIGHRGNWKLFDEFAADVALEVRTILTQRSFEP